MGDHFAADFGEAAEAAFDVEEAVVIDMADITGTEPGVVGEDTGGAFEVVEVTREDVRAFEPDHALLVERKGGVGFGVGDADGEAGHELADGAGAVAGELGGAGDGEGRRKGEVDVGDG